MKNFEVDDEFIQLWKLIKKNETYSIGPLEGVAFFIRIGDVCAPIWVPICTKILARKNRLIYE